MQEARTVKGPLVRRGRGELHVGYRILLEQARLVAEAWLMDDA